MKFMKLGIFKVLPIVFVLAVLVFAVPTQAFAYTIVAVNDYADPMFIAMVSWNDDAENWRCHGWQVVQPFSSKNIDVPNADSHRYVYIYANTKGRTFSGDGYPHSISRTVNNGKFDYWDGEQCPPGNNMRKVYFAQYEIVGGRVDFEP
ncbi:MAG: DUF1036 domain-containing protein [Negativicutes bacterium]|nr:DUF1036 domain-containing protein [Negativicutes bacterium]